MRFFLLFFTCFPFLSEAQITISEGQTNNIFSFDQAKPIIVTKRNNYTVVATLEYGKLMVIKFHESEDLKSLGKEIGEFSLGSRTDFLQWVVIDNKLLVVCSDFVKSDHNMLEKKTFLILLDSKGTEVARREMGPYLAYNFTLSVSPDNKHLVFSQRANKTFGEDQGSEDDEASDHILFTKLSPRDLKKENELEIIIDRTDVSGASKLTNSGMLYQCYSSGPEDNRTFYYNQIDIAKDSITADIPVIDIKGANIINCYPFLVGNKVGFAGLIKKKTDYLLFSSIFIKTDTSVSSIYQLSEEEVSGLYADYADALNKPVLVTSVFNLELQESHTVGNQTFLFFEAFAYKTFFFFNDLYVMKLDEKYQLSKCFSIPKRVRAKNYEKCGFAVHVERDSIKIFYNDFIEKYKRVTKGTNPFGYYFPEQSDYCTIAILSFGINSPDQFIKETITPKFFKRGYSIDWEWFPRNGTTPLTVLALGYASYRVVVIDW